MNSDPSFKHNTAKPHELVPPLLVVDQAKFKFAPRHNSNSLAASLYDDVSPSQKVLLKLLEVADASMPSEDVRRLCEAALDVDGQPTWNWCVRLGSVLSVATALGAVYVRCGKVSRASG